MFESLKSTKIQIDKRVKKKLIKNCKFCENEFIVKWKNQKFCSVKCVNRINAIKNTKHGKYIKKDKICPECKENHQKLTMNCCSHKCQVINKNRSIKKNSISKDIHSNFTTISSNARRVAKYFKEYRCFKCSYKLHNEVCHIKPVSEFDDNATLYEINHPDNLIMLCPNHHWEFDNGYLYKGVIVQSGRISDLHSEDFSSNLNNSTKIKTI